MPEKKLYNVSLNHETFRPPKVKNMPKDAFVYHRNGLHFGMNTVHVISEKDLHLTTIQPPKSFANKTATPISDPNLLIKESHQAVA